MRSVFLNGTVGAGKTSVADALGVVLATEGIPHAIIDLDQVRRGWPPPPDDPFNFDLASGNLAALATNYAAIGAELLVVAGVIEGAEELEDFRGILGPDLILVRLTVRPDVGAGRLRARHEGAGPDLEWHLDRLSELAAIIDEANLGDIVIDTSDLGIPEVAREIFDKLRGIRAGSSARTISFSSPSSEDEAIGMLAAASPPIGSPTQRQNLEAATLERHFERGSRRPEWVWEASDSHGNRVGVVAGWGGPDFGAPRILDVVAVPRDDPQAGRALLAYALERSAALGSPGLEIIQFAPALDPLNDTGVIATRAVIEQCGYRLLVQRIRYELDVASVILTIPTTELRFERVPDAADPRLERIMAELLVGSLDAHDLAALDVGDLQTVARETVVEYTGLDPIESFFLAFDRADALVGLVIGGLRGTTDRGVASFIGVSHLHRGRGYAGQLLGFITAKMVEEGAKRIIGETDIGNVPMARAFTFVGYPQTESRLDFVSAT
jgi:adenylylsulfate kinase